MFEILTYLFHDVGENWKKSYPILFRHYANFLENPLIKEYVEKKRYKIVNGNGVGDAPQ